MCLLLPYYKLSVVWFDMFNCTPSDGSFSLLYKNPQQLATTKFGVKKLVTLLY